MTHPPPKDIGRFAAAHKHGLHMAATLTAAMATGAACWLFMKGFEFVLDHRLDFSTIGRWAWLTTPAAFLLAVELVRRAAPCAAGTGIPQTMFAAKHLGPANERALAPLVSWRTMSVKILSLFIGVLAGASTGREGPTVHVAACVFMGVMLFFRRWTGLAVEMRPAVVAGGAAGLAAAFNTPLAGVTFAVEELTDGWFGGVKDFVLMAIIAAAMTAKALTGEYSYFGRLGDPSHARLAVTALIGVSGGLLGSLFCRALLSGQRAAGGLARKLGRAAPPILLSLCLLTLALVAGQRVLGPGNGPAQDLVGGGFGSWVWAFPLTKALATLLTYCSGIAGGIFAPCLSIGAAVGSGLARLTGDPLAAGALVGMAAFLSGTIQAPITSFVVIFEMTGRHDMLLPVMLASLAAFLTARLTGAPHLYHSLSENYRPMLPAEGK